jgi:hypothetical protein
MGERIISQEEEIIESEWDRDLLLITASSSWGK